MITISYSTIYAIIITIVYIALILTNKFGKGFYDLGSIGKFFHRLVTSKKLKNSTFSSRFRLFTLSYIIAWVIYFIIF